MNQQEDVNMRYYNFKNNNYNKPMFTKDENSTSLFDPYQGFIRGNLFPTLYNDYKLERPLDIQPMNAQAQALTYLDALAFAAHDINLYLDNYPEDRDMIALFNQYRMETNKITEEYERQYGPLLVSSNASNQFPWAWNQSPWPWEKE